MLYPAHSGILKSNHGTVKCQERKKLKKTKREEAHFSTLATAITSMPVPGLEAYQEPEVP